jgi:hypothetical protein
MGVRYAMPLPEMKTKSLERALSEIYVLPEEQTQIMMTHKRSLGSTGRVRAIFSLIGRRSHIPTTKHVLSAKQVEDEPDRAAG